VSKLFDHFQDMPLWLEASNLMLDINSAIEGITHPLTPKTLELAANLPAKLAFAGTNPTADIMSEVSATLSLAILLEHHLKILNAEKPAKALNQFKGHLILLIEDDMDGEFDDDE